MLPDEAEIQVERFSQVYFEKLGISHQFDKVSKDEDELLEFFNGPICCLRRAPDEFDEAGEEREMLLLCLGFEQDAFSSLKSGLQSLL